MTPAIIGLMGRTNWDGGHDDSLALYVDCDGNPKTMSTIGFTLNQRSSFPAHIEQVSR